MNIDNNPVVALLWVVFVLACMSTVVFAMWDLATTKTSRRRRGWYFLRRRGPKK